MECYMRFLLVPGIIALLIQPAYSQSNADVEDLKAARERKELEQQHKAIMDIIPDQKKKNSDPWGNVRSPEASKKKSN